MKYTSAEAAKLVRQLEEQIRDLQNMEEQSAAFHAAAGENPEDNRPEYDFAKTQRELEELQRKVRVVKHAINQFNITHELPGFEGLTVDQALILLPQLRAQKEKLRAMAARLPRARVENTFRTGNIIDYVITNYDRDEVQKAYQEAAKRLASIQLALDTLNTGEKMEIHL